MPDNIALLESFFEAYNRKDFEAMRRMMTPDAEMAAYNRGAAYRTRDELLAALPLFANHLAPDRKASNAIRVTAQQNVVVREYDFSGTATVDIHNMAMKGERFTLRLCSVFRFNDEGLIVEWRDHG